MNKLVFEEMFGLLSRSRNLPFQAYGSYKETVSDQRQIITRCLYLFILIHRVIKKFPELAIIYLEKRHSIHLSTAYIRGSNCDIPWKVSPL
jgi:hypothetical protein